MKVHETRNFRHAVLCKVSIVRPVVGLLEISNLSEQLWQVARKSMNNKMISLMHSRAQTAVVDVSFTVFISQ